MRIYIRVKKLGKHRNVLEPIPYDIPDSVASLRQLITAVVGNEVESYNKKNAELQLLPYLTAEQIEENAQTGKVGFGTIYSERKADKEQAVQNAVQCLEDGLIRVFMNEEEITELDGQLEMKEGAEFTFMRLTFLAGRMW